MEKIETHQPDGGRGSDEEQICRRNSVKYGKCKHVSGDNKLQYCDFHYTILTDFLTNSITSEDIEPPPDEERCCQSSARWRCKNYRMGHGDDDDWVPKRRYCEKHYNYYVNKYRNLKIGDGLCAKPKTRKKKKKVTEEEDDVTGNQPLNENPSFSLDMNLPPDEQRCCRRSRTWRCKNFSMGHGVDDDDDSVPKRIYCQKHYNDPRKKRNGDGTEGSGSSATWDSNCSKWRNKVTEEENDCILDVTGGIQPPTTGGSPLKSKTRKKVMEEEEDGCSLKILPQIRNPCFKDMNLPPDDERCSRTDGTRWRCKNLRMGHGDDDSVCKSTYCQKHYNDRVNYLLKKRNGDDTQGAGCSATRDSNYSKRRKEENDCSLDVTGIQPQTSDTTVGGGSANIGSGEVESLTGITETVVELKSLEHYKNKRFEYSVELEKKKVECTTVETEDGSANVGTKRKNVERTEWSGELDFTDFLITSNEMRKKKMEKKKLPPDVQFCCVHTRTWRCKNVRMDYGAAADDSSVPKTKFCEKHYNYYADIQDRKKILKKQTSGDGEGATGPIKRKRKTGERTEGSGEPISSPVELEKRKLECTKLPRILLGEMDTRKTAAKVEPEEWNKCSDLESRARRVENENLIKRCDISNLESLVQMIGKESSILRCLELRDFEKIESEAWSLQDEVTQAGEMHNTSIPNAESSIGGRKDSHVFELKTKENVFGIGINKHHESEYEFQNYAAANTSEDSDSSTDSKGSFGALMDMLAMKYRNRNEAKEIKWKFEADMLSSFEVEPELCLKAVCALYRQHVSEISANELFHYSDTSRCTTLAKFLMDGACKGELRKSVKELQIFDPKGVEDCKRLATSYSKQLFNIYQSRKDPCFLPATTASHGDQIAK